MMSYKANRFPALRAVRICQGGTHFVHEWSQWLRKDIVALVDAAEGFDVVSDEGIRRALLVRGSRGSSLGNGAGAGSREAARRSGTVRYGTVRYRYLHSTFSLPVSSENIRARWTAETGYGLLIGVFKTLVLVRLLFVVGRREKSRR